MRTILIGQAPFGAKTFEALQDAGENIVAVYTPQDVPGAKPDPLKEAALRRGTPVFRPKTYRADQVFREFADLKPDLVVLAFVTTIIPVRYFDAAVHGAICFHPSLLPRHRGASAINWAIIMGDARTGLSIFRPDEGIDTGPVLLQKSVDIGPDDTAGSLYFDRLFPMGVDAIVESVKLIKDGKAPKLFQEETGATYEPVCDDNVAAVDWNAGGREIYDLVRGCDPQPGAYAALRGEKVRFYNAGYGPGKVDAPAGTVTGLDDNGMRIACRGGELLVAKVRPASSGKLNAHEWAAGAGLKPGDRFERFHEK
jgi:methionyl-tRNA formyltransferase